MLYLEDINTPTLTEEKQKQCEHRRKSRIPLHP